MKNKQLSRIILFCSIFLTSTSAYAVGVGLRASSLGLGVEVTKSIYPKVNLRAGINSFSIDSDITEDGIDYQQTINLQSVAALIDWHPFAGGFRLTGGLLLNGNEVEIFSDSQSSFDIGDDTYTSDNLELLGLIRFQPVTPYLGLGWGSDPGSKGGWSVTAELGFVYMGEANVDLNATGTATIQGGNTPIDVTKDATFIENLILEEAALEDEIDEFVIYPVFSLGVNYAF